MALKRNPNRRSTNQLEAPFETHLEPNARIPLKSPGDSKDSRDPRLLSNPTNPRIQQMSEKGKFRDPRLSCSRHRNSKGLKPTEVQTKNLCPLGHSPLACPGLLAPPGERRKASGSGPVFVFVCVCLFSLSRGFKQRLRPRFDEFLALFFVCEWSLHCLSDI